MPLDKAFLAVAERFLRHLNETTGLPVILCDETGTIVRATVRSRIGDAHAGAQRILRGEVDEAFVTAEEAAANPAVKEGCNCPIAVGGRRVGTFGVAGPMEVSRPVARIASSVLAGWLRETRQRAAVEAASAEAGAATRALSGRLEAAAAESARALEELAASAREAAARLDAAAGVVQTVQEIAQQSRILSINGAIQATRAGEHGLAFAVVARDMTQLAEQTATTAKAIEARLAEVRTAVAGVREAAGRSAASGKSQEAALGEMRGALERIQAAVQGLQRGLGEP